MYWRAIKDGVLCVAVSPVNPQVVATASEDNTVRIWSLSSRKTMKCFATMFSEEPSVLAFHPKGSILAAAAGPKLYLLNLDDPDLIVKTAMGGVGTL